MKKHGGTFGRDLPWDGPATATTKATKAAAADNRCYDDHNDTTKGQRMKLETTMLGRAGNHRVILNDDDDNERSYYGVPSTTRAGRFHGPLAWAVAAARVAWGAVAGTGNDRRDGDVDHGDVGPMETR